MTNRKHKNNMWNENKFYHKTITIKETIKVHIIAHPKGLTKDINLTNNTSHKRHRQHIARNKHTWQNKNIMHVKNQIWYSFQKIS
jgi:hypothetical protein